MPSFGKGGGSHNSHEMILSGMPGIGILICPSVQIDSSNIGIWRGSTPIYTSMFWVTLASDSTSFWYGDTLHMMILT